MSKKSSTESTVLDRHPDYDGIKMKMPDGREFHVGYSRLSSFFQCPKSFKYTYIDKIRSEGGVPVRRGQAYHNALEKMLQFKQDTGDLLDLRRCEKLAIRSAKAEQLAENDILKVVDAVRFYYGNKYDIHMPVAVERDFKIVRGGVEITGRIDLIEEDGYITDHKFSYDTWADARAKYGCQPMIYQWAAIDQFEHEFPGWKYKGFKYNILRLFPSPLIQEITIKKLKQAQSDWWEEQIFEAARIIRRGYFPAIPSDKNCQYCDHKQLCKPTVYRLKKENIGAPNFDDDDY